MQRASFNICILFLIKGCLIEGVPDVPPRNPTMSRLNGRVQGIVNDLDMDFEPSCLVRTPSGNVYIPSGNLSKYMKNTIFKPIIFFFKTIFKKLETF